MRARDRISEDSNRVYWRAGPSFHSKRRRGQQKGPASPTVRLLAHSLEIAVVQYGRAHGDNQNLVQRHAHSVNARGQYISRQIAADNRDIVLFEPRQARGMQPSSILFVLPQTFGGPPGPTSGPNQDSIS